jgi:hypothetical protein
MNAPKKTAFRSWMLLASLALGPSAWSQIVIPLDSVIGPAGTDAVSVLGVGNAVNQTGVPSNSGSTQLTAVSSTGSSWFDFNAGFADHVDRTIGATANNGTHHVIADRGYDSANATSLILDKNNNGSFVDEVDNVPGDAGTFNLGFGLHADGFITFDLAVIRANNGLAAHTAFTLTGGAGVNNNANAVNTSAAIVLDGTELAVFDWQTGAPYHQFDTFSLSIPETARYLTFAGLSGINYNISYDHIGFSDVQLTAIPEPGTGSMAIALLALAATGWQRWFRRQRRAANGDHAR